MQRLLSCALIRLLTVFASTCSPLCRCRNISPRPGRVCPDRVKASARTVQFLVNRKACRFQKPSPLGGKVLNEVKRMRGDLLAGKSEIKKQKTGAAARMDVCSSPLCLGNLPCSLRNAQQEEMAFKNGSSVHAAVLAVRHKACGQQEHAAEGSAHHRQPVCTACGQHGRGGSVYCAVTLAMT